MKLVWLNSALYDIDRIRQFIEPYNLTAARNAATLLIEAVKSLAACPQIGKPVAELPGYRDFPVRFGAGGYVIRYRIEESVLYIVHIRHYRESNFKSEPLTVHEPAGEYHTSSP